MYCRHQLLYAALTQAYNGLLTLKHQIQTSRSITYILQQKAPAFNVHPSLFCRDKKPLCEYVVRRIIFTHLHITAPLRQHKINASHVRYYQVWISKRRSHSNAPQL